MACVDLIAITAASFVRRKRLMLRTNEGHRWLKFHDACRERRDERNGESFDYYDIIRVLKRKESGPLKFESLQ